MKKVVVSDTNIFIDLIDAGLIKSFFECGLEVHTTAMVIDEITNEKQKEELLSQQGLIIRKYKEAEYRIVYEYYTATRRHSNLSVTDCSVLLYAKDLDCPLITNDGKLRGIAMGEGLEVKRLLSIIMYMVEAGAIYANTAISAMERLMETNSRAPRELIVKFIEELEVRNMG